MKLIALLSWYDEKPAWLDATIRSLTKLNVDHLVAIDGAYALYPNGRARSHLDQYEAITRAAHDTNIGLTIHAPQTVWEGNEIAKRNHLFRVADTIAQPNKDWYLVIDGDETIRKAPDIREQLRTSVFDVAEATLVEPHPVKGTRSFPLPMLFRAIPGLRCDRNHFTYRTPDGRALWGNALFDRLEPRLPLHDIQVDHRTNLRHQDRHNAANAYYQARDDARIEECPCTVQLPDGTECGKPTGHTLPQGWRLSDNPEEDGATANWITVCREHAPTVAMIGCQQLAALIGDEKAARLYTKRNWITRAGPGPANQPVAA